MPDSSSTLYDYLLSSGPLSLCTVDIWGYMFLGFQWAVLCIARYFSSLRGLDALDASIASLVVTTENSPNTANVLWGWGGQNDSQFRTSVADLQASSQYFQQETAGGL